MTYAEALTKIETNCLWRGKVKTISTEESQPSGKAITEIQVPVTVKRLDGTVLDQKQMLRIFDLGGEQEEAFFLSSEIKDEAEETSATTVVYTALLTAVATTEGVTKWSVTNKEFTLLGDTVNIFALLDDNNNLVTYWSATTLDEFKDDENPHGLMTSFIPSELI